MEVKLLKNTRFWHGLERQLPKYLEAENVKFGYFIAVCFQDKELDKLLEIESRVENLNKQLPYRIEVEVVEAQRNPVSASKL